MTNGFDLAGGSGLAFGVFCFTLTFLASQNRWVLNCWLCQVLLHLFDWRWIKNNPERLEIKHVTFLKAFLVLMKMFDLKAKWLIKNVLTYYWVTHERRTHWKFVILQRSSKFQYFCWFKTSVCVRNTKFKIRWSLCMRLMFFSQCAYLDLLLTNCFLQGIFVVSATNG